MACSKWPGVVLNAVPGSRAAPACSLTIAMTLATAGPRTRPQLVLVRGRYVTTPLCHGAEPLIFLNTLRGLATVCVVVVGR